MYYDGLVYFFIACKMLQESSSSVYNKENVKFAV